MLECRTPVEQPFETKSMLHFTATHACPSSSAKWITFSSRSCESKWNPRSSNLKSAEAAGPGVLGVNSFLPGPPSFYLLFPPSPRPLPPP